MAGKEKIIFSPKDLIDSSDFFMNTGQTYCHIVKQRKEVRRVFHRGDGCGFLGVLAVSMGCGILIAAIFPTGALMFLVAFLLIACGCACCKR